MSPLSSATRSNVGVIRIGGEDRDSFLQGLISVDVTRLTADTSLYGALLTPQGKYLYDFFLTRKADGSILMQTEADRLAGLLKKLTMYKLRSKVDLQELTGAFKTVVVYGDGTPEALGLAAVPGSTKTFENGVIAFVDPRLIALGARLLIPAGTGAAFAGDGDEAGYTALRMRLGVAEGARELLAEKSILLETGFEELNGVDFQKGCYMGQELTARTKYRALIRRRLLTVTGTSDLPEPGTSLVKGGKTVGELRAASAHLGIALVKLDSLKADGAYHLADTEVTVGVPDWVTLPEKG